MALTNKPQPPRIQMLNTTAPPVRHGIEAASQTWTIAAPLIDDDAGSFTLATSPIGTANGCFAFATNPATGVTAADVLAVMATGDVMIEATLSDPAGTHTLVQADLWSVYPYTIDGTFSTRVWYLNGAAETAAGFMVVGFKDPVGTVDGRVYATIVPASRINGDATAV